MMTLSRLGHILVEALLILATILPAENSRTSAADTWYVVVNGNDNNPCNSAEMPCATIDMAVSKAVPGDTILVGAGEYTSTFSNVVTISKDLLLIGGWEPTFTTNNGMSILNGQNQRRGLMIGDGANVSMDRFTIQLGYTENNNGGGILNVGELHLSNAEISHNLDYLTGAGVYKGGGGIFNSGLLTLDDCQITNNEARYANGGGIYNQGTVMINDCVIQHNIIPMPYGGIYGGGIYNSGTMTVTNSTISNNMAYGYGGGFYNFNSASQGPGILSITSTTISENVSRRGGGIYIYGGELTLSYSEIINNESTYGQGGGVNLYGGTIHVVHCLFSGNVKGGISNDIFDPVVSLDIDSSKFEKNTIHGILVGSSNGTLEVSNSEFIENSGVGIFVGCGLTNITGSNIERNTDGGIQIECGSSEKEPISITHSNIAQNGGINGAGIHNYQGNLVIKESSIISNTATTGGGGIYNQGTITITNTTIARNYAQTGGGIFNIFGFLATNITIFENFATTGGGFYDNSNDGRFRNSIIAGNTGGNCTNPVESDGYNIDDGNTCKFIGPGDIIRTDPELAQLTQIQESYIYPLQVSSPAVDAGSNAFCPLTDQIDTHRPLDGDEDNIPVCDIGAFEYGLDLTIQLNFLPIIFRD